MPFISTPCQAIEALGGTKAVAALFDIDPRVVLNWQLPERRLPPDTYDVMGRALMGKGFKFSSHHLFGQREAAMSAHAAATIGTRRYRRNAGNGK